MKTYYVRYQARGGGDPWYSATVIPFTGEMTARAYAESIAARGWNARVDDAEGRHLHQFPAEMTPAGAAEYDYAVGLVPA